MNLETYHLDFGDGVSVSALIDPARPSERLDFFWMGRARRRHVKPYLKWLRPILQNLANRTGKRIAYCLALPSGRRTWLRMEPEKGGV